MADNVVIEGGGRSGSGGGWGILGVILGVALVIGILALVFAGPQIASWWGDNGSGTTHATISTPAGSATATTHTNP